MADGMAELRSLLLANPALQEKLATILAADQFCLAAREIAAEHGLAVEPGALDQATRPDPLGLSRFERLRLAGAAWPPVGWLPARTQPGPTGPEFDWIRFGMGPLQEPFFEDSTRRAAALPLNRLLRCRTSLAELCEATPRDGMLPQGFIFHLSRCGSTLLARLLASYPGHAKISEAEAVDAVVQWAATLPPDEAGGPNPYAVEALRSVVRALMHNLEEGTRTFFKLDCWHIGAVPLFRAAFPDVPWLFLYRDPIEVAVSQQAMPGVHVVPGMLGAALLGILGGEDLPAEIYISQVLGRICEIALTQAEASGGLLLHYNEIFTAMAGRLPAHFGFTPDLGAAARQKELANDNAKFPGQDFRSDGAAKRAQADPRLCAAIAQWAEPAYAALEAKRKNSLPTHRSPA